MFVLMTLLALFLGKAWLLYQINDTTHTRAYNKCNGLGFKTHAQLKKLTELEWLWKNGTIRIVSHAFFTIHSFTRLKIVPKDFFGEDPLTSSFSPPC